MDEMFLEHVEQALFGKGLWQHVVHAVLEVHGDVVTSNVRCHGDDWRGIELSDQVAGRDSVQVWHDDIHKNQVVLRAGVHLVNRLESIKLHNISQVTKLHIPIETYSTVNGAVESIKELASDATAGRVIFNQQDLRRTNPPRVCKLSLLSNLYRLTLTCLWRLRRHCVRNVIDMLTVHWVNSIVLANRIDHILEVVETHGAGGCS